MLEGKVLITGGTGSLSEHLLERANNENWDAEFIIFSRSESRQAQLKRKYPKHRYVLGDVGFIDDLERVMCGVDTVLHFAAYKRVESAQNNVSATVRTNVIGSENVARCAVRYGVKHVVGTSSDKAVESESNYYGQSKTLMEGLFKEANQWGNTVFTLARYGNVLGSTGSVAVLFDKQVKAGGPLTVTSRTMTRFWLTFSQAIDIVLHAMQQEPGTITVPKAHASTMETFARAFVPDGMLIDIVEIGTRPGEKQCENMVSLSESLHTDQDDNYFYIRPPKNDLVLYQGKEMFRYTSDQAPQLTVDDLREMMGLNV
jgi:UDP-glucose 4-epimerase